MSNFLKISEQSFFQILGKIITSLSTLIILSFITRTFGTTGTGVFTLSLAYLAFFYLIVDFGLNAHLLPELIGGHGQWEWQNLLGLRLLLSLVLIVAAFLLIHFLPFTNSLIIQTVQFGLLTILGYGIFITSAALFQAKLEYQKNVICSILLVIPPLLVVFLAVPKSLTIPEMVGAYSVGYLISAVFSLALVSRISLPKLNPSFLKKTLKEVWPISATLLLNTLYFRADTFILGSIKPLSDVGIYNIAYQIFQSALVIPTFITNSYYPMMLQNLQNNRKEFFLDLKKILALMLGLGILGVIATLALSPFVIELVGGNKGFTGSITSLNILSLSFPAFFLTSTLMWTLVSLKKYKTMLWIYLVGLLVNIFLNFLLIPHYSFIASSWITCFAEYLILILQLIILLPTLKNS